LHVRPLSSACRSEPSTESVSPGRRRGQIGGRMRRTGWTVATACAAAVVICGAQLVGTNGQVHGNGQDAAGFAAAEGERRACTVRILRGSYVFSATGFNIVGGVQQPKAIVEVIAFHGDNTLDVPCGNGEPESRDHPQLSQFWNYISDGNSRRTNHPRRVAESSKLRGALVCERRTRPGPSRGLVNQGCQ
jgi:hypothetical protein